MAEILRGVIAVETTADSIPGFPEFVFRLSCGHTVQVSRQQMPPVAEFPTRVRCPKCEAGRYGVCDYGVMSDDPVH